MAVLNIRRTGADEYGKFIRALFLGDPGAGKTLTASTWPNPLYASAEGGLMSVADRGVNYAEITASDQLLKLRNALNQPPEVREKLVGVPVDTLIVDTIDEIQRILIRERLETTKKETLSVQDFGWLGDQMRSIIRGLRTLPLHVVCTCHLKKGDEGANDSGRIMGPALQGQVGDEIAQYFDIVALLKGTVLTRIVGDQTKRVQVKLMQTYPDIQHPWIKDRSGKLAPEIELDFVNDYQQLFDAIYGGEAMAASADIRSVEDRHVAAERQAKIEEDLAASTTGDKPTAAKASAAKKAAPAKAAAPAEKAAPKAAEKAPEPAPEPDPEPETAKAPESPEEAPETAPEPAEEPVAEQVEQPTLAEPEPEPEPETEPEPESSTEPEESVEAGTGLTCEDCNGEVENDDQADLSRIRFRKVLCRACFVAAKKSK